MTVSVGRSETDKGQTGVSLHAEARKPGMQFFFGAKWEKLITDAVAEFGQWAKGVELG
jgi:hypothetical protein